MNRGALAAISMLFAGHLLSGLASQQTRPQRPPPPNIVSKMDAPVPPSTLKALWDYSSMVAEVEILHTTQRYLETKVPVPDVLPILQHEVHVIRIFKDDGRTPKQNEIKVSEPGGAVAVNGTTFSAEMRDTVPLTAGQKGILFLDDWTAAGNYSVAYGPAGEFCYDRSTVGNRLWIHPNARPMTELKAQAYISASDFRALLKTFEKQ